MSFVTCVYMMSFFMIIKVALLDMQNADIAVSTCSVYIIGIIAVRQRQTATETETETETGRHRDRQRQTETETDRDRDRDIIGTIAVSTCKRSLFIIVIGISAVAIPVAQQDAPSAKR